MKVVIQDENGKKVQQMSIEEIREKINKDNYDCMNKEKTIYLFKNIPNILK